MIDQTAELAARSARRDGGARGGRDGGRLAALLFWSLAAAVLIAPLPFGAVLPGAWGLLICFVALIVGLWALGLLLRGGPWSPSFGRLWYVWLPFGLVIAWALLQAAGGLPAPLHHPLWAEAAAALGRPLEGAISIDPKATLLAAGRLLGYGAIVLAAYHLTVDDGRALRFLGAFALVGAAYAVYGLAVGLSGSETVLWHRKTAYLGSVTGTFINRNSFATYCGLGLVAATTLLVDRFAHGADREIGRRERRVRLLSLPGRAAPWLLAWACLMTGLLLSQSRAGLAATLAALLVVFAAFGYSGRIGWRAVAAASLPFLLVGALFLAVSGEGTVERLGATTLESEQRLEIFREILVAIEQRPWLGTGLGTFEQAFAAVKPATITGVVHLGHNSYLELALELGLPAAALLALSVAGLAFCCLRGLRRRRLGVLFPVAGLAASVLVGLHALVDFSLQIPAVAAGYAMLMGVAARCSFRTR